MRTTCAIAIVLVSVQLTGCSWARKLWPWGREDSVPVTRPIAEDANVVFPEPPAAAATQPVAADVAAGAARPEAPDGIAPMRYTPPRAINKPTNLTDLLLAPAIARPSIATQPASRPAKGEPPAVVQAPATTMAARSEPPPARSILEPGTAPTQTGPVQVVAASALQVNNRFISIEDILRRLGPKLAKLPPRISEPAFRQQVGPWIADEVRQQVIRALVVDEAQKRLTDKQKKQIDTEVQQAGNDMLAEAGGSKTQLRQTLIRRGTTLQQVLAEHRENVTFRFHLRGRFMPAITITRKMLWDHYRQNHEKYTTGKKVQMRLIAAPFNRFLPKGVTKPSHLELAAARKRAAETIDKALQAIRKGEDFGEVAKRLSRGVKASAGGLWPLMEIDTFRETQVEKAAFGLMDDQIAGPVETKHGLYIVKAVRVQPGKVVSFEDAQEEIEETLRNRLYLELTEKYFKDLLASAHVVRSEKFAQIALNKAAERHFKK